jgi:hypothetical protein
MSHFYEQLTNKIPALFATSKGGDFQSSVNKLVRDRTGASKPGFFTKRGVRTPRLGKKPGFWGGSANPVNNIFRYNKIKSEPIIPKNRSFFRHQG